MTAKYFFSFLTLILVSSVAGAAEDGNTYDHTLTAQEVKTLLPQYLYFIEKQISLIPSPVENQILRQLGGVENYFGAFDKNNKPVGSTTHDMGTIIKDNEYLLQQLKAVTLVEREASTGEVLDGFRAGKGKIVCQAGYLHGFKFDDQRIVRCDDSHSSKQLGDDRWIVLSVLPADLTPVGILLVEHVVAD